MKIQDCKHLHEPFDVATGLGNWLISIGQFEKYVAPAAPLRIFDTVWQVKTSSRNDSGATLPPFIAARCSCSAAIHFEGPSPATIVLMHHAGCSGGQELVPAAIADEYLALRKIHYKNFKPAAPAGIDPLAERRKNPERFLIQVNS